MLREDTGRAAEGMEEMGFFSALGSALVELAGGVASALDEAQKKKVHDLEISFRRKSRKDLLCVLMSDERVTPERIAAFSILKKEYFGGSAEALKELLDGPVSVENIGVPIRAVDDEEWMRLVRDSQKYSDL